MSAPRWQFTAHFENRDQAKQAADILRALQPAYLHIAYAHDGTGEGPIRPWDWEEYGRGYFVNEGAL